MTQKSSTKEKEKSIASAAQDEQILVIPRKELFKKHSAWSGLKAVNFDDYLNLIQEKKEFQPRAQMELDQNYKQIIPYLVYTHEERFFLMQRTSQATEKRLQNKYSLGIGGHIRQEDMASNSLFDWATREFHEEVAYNGKLTIEPLGVLNDDSNAVGQVHIGFVFLLHGEHSDINIKSELKSGELLTVAECEPYFSAMESWSQIVFTHLLQYYTK